MRLIILTPEKQIFNGDIISVKVPGTNGQFEILRGHAPIVSALENGKIRIITDKEEKIEIEIVKGFIEVLNNEVSLLIQQMVTQT